MHEIYVEQLTKKFKQKLALERVSLRIQGSYGLLGPNGAGKTTLMRILATIIEPDHGMIKYKNLTWRQKDEIKQMIGYLPQHFSAFKQLKVAECLDHFAVLKGITNKQKRKENIAAALQQVNLSDQADAKIKTLSGGMMRRLGIAQALLGDPEILIVDEPTAGLDVQERARFRTVLKKIQENRIIIISTHIVEDLEAVCTNIGIINRGKVVKEGRLRDIVKEVEGKIWKIHIHADGADKIKEENIISTFTEGNEQFIKFISEEKPGNAEPVAPNLEDAYLYFNKG